MSEIEKLFKNSNIAPKSVDKIMVIDGPGSFTGVRIGVTIAKTYAWACKINVVPISTLKAYALSLDGYDYYIPLMDARRGYVYGAIYDSSYKEILKPQHIELDKLMKYLNDKEDYEILSNDNYDDEIAFYEDYVANNLDDDDDESVIPESVQHRTVSQKQINENRKSILSIKKK